MKVKIQKTNPPQYVEVFGNRGRETRYFKNTTVHVSDSSSVVVTDCVVFAYDLAKVKAFGKSTVITFGTPVVTTFGKSKVVIAWGEPKCGNRVFTLDRHYANQPIGRRLLANALRKTKVA